MRSCKKKTESHGFALRQVPETCPLSRYATEVSRDEVLKYRSMAPLPLAESGLDWWKSHETELPILANLARRYLCIPATSVASERVFSTAGDMASSQRSGVQPNCVQLIFLKKISSKVGKKHVIAICLFKSLLLYLFSLNSLWYYCQLHFAVFPKCSGNICNVYNKSKNTYGPLNM